MKNADWRAYPRPLRNIVIQNGATMWEVYYHGERVPTGVTVNKNVGGSDRALSLRTDLWNHSPTGFEWGYGGSGPAQLALALLADCLHDDEKAVELHQAFKWDIVARFGRESWTLSVADLNNWLYRHDQAGEDQEHGRESDDSGVDLDAAEREEQPHDD